MAPLLAFGPSLKVAGLAPNMDHHRVTSYGAHGACLYRHHHIKVFEHIFNLIYQHAYHTCKKRVIPVIYHRKYFWIFRKILG